MRLMKKILLIPVGEQLSPLLYGMKYCGEIDEVILLHTSKTKKHSKKIEKNLKEIFFIKKINQLECDARNLPSILNTLLNKLSQYNLKNLYIISNLSGGTKMMALACYILASFFNGFSFYIFKKNEEMEYVEVPNIKIKIWEKLNPQRLRYRIIKLLEVKECRLSELSKQLGIKESTTTYYLNDMENEGWIRRVGKRYKVTEFGRLAKCLADLLE